MTNETDLEDISYTNYEFFSQTVDIYTMFGNDEQLRKHTHYFSKYLNRPSVCIEIDGNKYEFYIAINTMQNNEAWLFRHWSNKSKEAGGGHALKLNAYFLKDVKEYILSNTNVPKEEKRQLTIFDFM